MKKGLLVAIMILFAWPGNGFSNLQAQNNQPEEIYVHFDRDIYITGEDIRYKVYVMQRQNIGSEVVYIDLIDPTGQVIYKQKLKPVGRVAWGDFRIPPSWNEGLYTFRAYTYWNLNFGSDYIFKKKLPIYKLPDSPLVLDETNYQLPEVKAYEAEGMPFRLALSTDKPIYKRREKVQLTIRLQDGNGQAIKANFSLAVKDGTLLTRKTHPASILQAKADFNQLQLIKTSLSEINFPVEKGLTLRVGIRDEGLQRQILGSLTSVFIVESREKVRRELIFPPLTFYLPDFYASRTLQFYEFQQFPKDTAYIVENMASYLENQPDQTPLLHTPEIDRYLELARQRKQFQQIFDLESIPPIPAYDKPAPADPADKIYPLDDFVSFGNLYSFLEEVISTPLVKLVDKGRQKSVRLLNQDSDKRAAGPPVYLVNNYITLDERLAHSLDWDNVDRIELFTRNISVVKHFGTLGVNGGLAFYTRDGQTPDAIAKAPFNHIFEGYYKARPFSSPNYNAPEIRQSKLPDFRGIEYWHPHLETDENGEAQVSFFTSDAKGVFLVHVEGVDEGGRPVIGEVVYTVD